MIIIFPAHLKDIATLPCLYNEACLN